MGHLRIHISRVSRFETADKTVRASRNVSAVLNFAVPRFESAEKTVCASQPGSALLRFAAHPIGSPVKGSRQLCCRGVELIHINPINYQLLALSCGHRSLVGASIARPFAMLLPELKQNRRERIYPFRCDGFVGIEINNRRGEHCSPFRYGFVDSFRSRYRKKCIGTAPIRL